MITNNRKALILPLVIVAILQFVSCQSEKEIGLLTDGQSKYFIIIDDQADSITRYAAMEFQKYFGLATGVELQILDEQQDESDFEVVIGSNLRTIDLHGELHDLDEDGFIIQTLDDKVFILGGKEKGTLYGVYTFLENYLGLRKYSHEVEYIPQLDNISIPNIDLRQEPAFAYRELHMPMSRWDPQYRDWHKLDAKEGKNEWGMFVHTFDDFIPAQHFFNEHPEYFSFLNVKRVPDGQLCLSNPTVFSIVMDSLRSRMSLKPEALYWSVSQNDTYKPCECEPCKEQYQEYGGYSGAMIHFVNKVAAEFPDKVISTLAYQYTRSAPTNITPADNVNIMFCSIECNRSRPLTTDPSSESFRKDTEDWCKLTSNIFMWDYVVQFRNLVSPFPNFRVLQPNIQYFRDNGMQMMFQQGSGGLISEFVELRSYIIAKLLWNPDADVDRLMEDFCMGYYGDAGEYILQYIRTMHDNLDETGGDLGIYGYPYDGINTYLTPTMMDQYSSIFDQAEKAVESQPEFLQRIKIARLPLEFAILDISLRDVNEDLSYFSKEDDTWVVKEDMLSRLDELTALAKQAGIARYWEHGNYPDDYSETVRRYATTSMQPNIALSKPAQLAIPASDKYPVGGASALTDGLKGINDYHFNWLGFEGPDLEAIIDLGEETKISKIEMDFLQEIKSWVFLPENVEVFVSTTGEEFQALGSWDRNAPTEQEGTFIETFTLEFETTEARYVKVLAHNRGICPDWHPGATYPAWIFCDEIMVW